MQPALYNRKLHEIQLYPNTSFMHFAVPYSSGFHIMNFLSYDMQNLPFFFLYFTPQTKSQEKTSMKR